MRIMHFILSRGFAGSERATAEMCNAHAAAHEVLLVVRRGQRRHGVGIRDYLDSHVAVREVHDLWPGPGLREAMAAFRPEIVHAHLRRAARLLARASPPCPTIATLHLWLNGSHYLSMDGLIVIAQWQKRGLDGYAGRVFDINESLVPHRCLAPMERARLRADLGASQDDFLIGGVGRLVHSKGFDLLIRAFLRAAPAQAKLVIVGEGRERRRLEKLAAGRALFTGFRSDVKDCYQALDLFVSPSRSEPLGRVVLEALDGGAPVLATATEGPSEILTRFPGTLVPVADEAALAGAIAALAHERPPRHRPDLSDYHLERIAAQTLAAYQTLAGAARARLMVGAMAG
jgi:glycosyltransferase involved in cell wall biosynthesis